jgi:AraC-like DNA-binding protein
MRRFEFSTRDESETEDFIRRMYVGNRSQFLGGRDGARFTATLATSGGIACGRVRSTVDYRADCEPFDHFLFLSVGNGRLHIAGGGTETIVLAGEETFYPLGYPLDVRVIDTGVRTLQLPVARMAEMAADTAGIRAADLRFDSIRPVSVEMARQWSALVELVTGLFLAEDEPMPALLVEELTRTAALTALHTFPNTALSVSYQPGPSWVAPAAVRRAAAFIQANADRPITPGQIAEAAGVGGRVLRDAFRRHFGTTAVGYLRRIRLERAHEELRAADPTGVTVARIAQRWGWTSPGKFAAAYRRRFGTLPGATLRT